jgi:hypothetical protein
MLVPGRVHMRRGVPAQMNDDVALMHAGAGMGSRNRG